MAEVKRVAEKIPGWVERILIPSLESRVRGVVREEIDHLAKLQDAKFEAVNTRFDSLEKRINDRFDAVDARFLGVDARFDGMNAKFDAMDTKFDAMNTRFDGVDEKFESLEKRIALIQDVADLKARLAAVEKRAS